MTIEKLEALERGIDLTNASTLVGVVNAFPALLVVANAAKAYVDDMSEESMGRYDALVNALEKLEATP